MEDLSYLRSLSQLLAIKERTAALQFSMASEPLVGALLRTLAASCLLAGMDAGSNFITVDNDRAVQRVAGDSLGADRRLILVTFGGLEFLRGQPAGSFDYRCCENRGFYVIERLAAHSGFEILPLVWASGIVVAVRKNN